MPIPPPVAPFDIHTLRTILRDLRHPVHGCPWDKEQEFQTIAPYTIEEAYEVADAIDRKDMSDLQDELGDLLLQVIYHSQIASEAGAFTLDHVLQSICAKMIRRHPHVYHQSPGPDDRPTERGWEAIKASERGESSALAGVALGLPALMRAEKLQRRASRVGFDWPDASGPRAKITEELEECEGAKGPAELNHEIGDLLFSVVNWARHLQVDAESALREANQRFEARFAVVESLADRSLADLTPEALDNLWELAKQLVD